VPKGGEKLVSGEKYLLKWNTIGFKPSDTVQIEIWDSRRNCPVGDPGCLRGGDILVSNITNTGSYIWNANLSKMAGYYGSTTEPVYRFRITVGQVPSTEQSKVGSAWSQPFSIIPAKQTQTTQAIPFLSSISPSSARYGDTVTLYGSNLSNIVTNQLSIRNSSGGEINPSIISKTSTSITFKLPNIPYETYDVMVFDANDSNSLKLTVLSPTQTGVGAPSTSPSSSSYIAPAPTYTTPYITKTSPTIVKAGDTVTLEGVNFEGVDSSLVFIRNNTGGEINPEVTSISNTKITFKVPNISYGTYSVSLLGDKGDSNTVTITIGSTSGASAISVWGWLEKMFR
jgi:hypothetical protein